MQQIVTDLGPVTGLEELTIRLTADLAGSIVPLWRKRIVVILKEGG
jgi:hypothetical protein